MTRHRVITLTTAIASAVALGALIGGAPVAAGSMSPKVAAPSDAVRAADCDLVLADPDPDNGGGALVVLLDGTLSSSTQEGRTGELLAVVDAVTDGRHVAVSVGSFGGSDADVRYDRCLDGVEFVAAGNNARTRQRNRARLLDDTAALLGAMASGYESSDPTAALRAGVRRLDERAGRADPAGERADGDGNTAASTRLLVIHTDGIPTAGCAALPAEVDVSSPTLIDELVARCIERGQLPDATGIDIVVGGIGRTDEHLGNDAVRFLIELNTALCEATGATCRVDPNFPTTF